MTLSALAWMGAWVLGWWSSSPAVAIMGAFAIGTSYSGVLAAEFVLLRRIRKGDPTPPGTGGELLRAWWAETLEGLRVFAWRQPWRWRAIPDHLVAGPQAGKHGIVFIHGFVCNRGFWTPWLQAAKAGRRDFVAVNLEPVMAGIDEYVPLVDAAAERVRQATGLPPVLVCHSMGGLVARAWLRTRAADARDAVAHVVTIGSPHAGTWLARLSHLPNGRQMRPASDWLRHLQQAWTPELAARFTCWYSNCDNIVMPPSTATLPGADNRMVRGAAHVNLAFRPEVMRGTFDLIDRLDRQQRPH